MYAVCGQVMEHIPALEQSAYDASLEPAPANSASAAAPSSAAADLAELLALDVDGGAAAGTAAPVAAAAAPMAAVSALQDMLAGDLLGGGGAAPPATTAAPAVAAATHDPLADLFGGAGGGAAAAAAAPITITAYDKGGINIKFVLSKAPADPAVTHITATYTNLSSQPVTNFVLQVGGSDSVLAREFAGTSGRA